MAYRIAPISMTLSALEGPFMIETFLTVTPPQYSIN